ncbi:MAG: class I SAM-dependent methyltransferase [Phyllobacterium sp.]|uniref:class I SAM-dependent methyltransferase n=1 Tax=Phyllobacterium sp. TaxID=1871046 RepID=UPI0030F18AD5
MTDGALKTLFLPFEDEILPIPGGERWLFLGAEANRDSEGAWRDILSCLQPFRPDFLDLEKAGFNAVPRLESSDVFDGALILIGKHRGRNEAWLAQAFDHVKPGGTIVVSGDKKLGVDSFRKTVETLAPVTDRLSKHHAVAFWLTRPERLDSERLEALKSEPTRLEGRYVTGPGMFSHTAIDKGSALLAAHFEGRIGGHVADFGAGWGYLASELLGHREKMKSLALYEADFEALEAARQNVVAPAEIPVSFHWHDVNREPISDIYDTIVMNPPFHAGRSADPTMGQGFIAVAAKRLKPGGRLLLVANRQMPYEAGLNALFRSVTPLQDDAGYKIIEAKK